MMEYILVGAGGALGSLARYLLGKKISAKSYSKLPFGTFIINVSGAVLLGLVINIRISGNLYLLFADGFLGAYTTFSTFMYESFHLFKDNKLNSTAYIISSLILGFTGFASGIAISNLL